MNSIDEYTIAGRPKESPANVGSVTSGILAADLVGYSKLASKNIHEAVKLLRDTRHVLVSCLRQYDIDEVKTAGDFVLALFEQPSDLLRAACDVQRHLLAYHKISGNFDAGHWKIGLAVGPVHSIDNDHYGNAINVASRLQSFAGPGEIWFTEEVQAISELPNYAVSTSLGGRALKNIVSSVRVFRVKLPEYSSHLGARSSQTIAPENLDEHTRIPVVEMKPFKSLGGERSDLMAEALTEELGLILSRVRGSIILTMDYRKGAPDYVLRGTVQSHGEQFRIAAQLISSADGESVFAERFNGDISGSFDFQDQIARDIVSSMQVALTEGEQAQLWRRGTTSGEAWEAFQKGHDLVRRYTREDHERAKRNYQRALSFDPNYLCAIVALGFCHLDELRLGWSPDAAQSLKKASALVKRAGALAERHADALALEAYVSYFRENYKKAVKLIHQAVTEAPESSEIIGYKGALHDLMGDFEQAIESYKVAISKSLFSPAWIPANLALTLLALNKDVEAEQVFNKVLLNHPRYVRAWIGLTVAYVRQGRIDEAKKAGRQLLTLDPKFGIEEWAKSKPFSDPLILKGFKADLVSAGLS